MVPPVSNDTEQAPAAPRFARRAYRRCGGHGPLQNIQPDLGSTREMRERLRETRDYTLTILFGVVVPCLDKVNALITYDIY